MGTWRYEEITPHDLRDNICWKVHIDHPWWIELLVVMQGRVI